MTKALLVALGVFAVAVTSTAASHPSISDAVITETTNPPQLSAFGFFDGGPDKPSAKLIPYDLKTPLFSDYAEKQRFIYIPEGGELSVDRYGKMDFPVGTALIKSFGYHDISGNLNIIETRLLLHRQQGWVALPYVWRTDHKEADLRVGGTRVLASFNAPGGKAYSVSYAVPNKNQCKQCHSTKDQVMPIGPVLQNMVFARDSERQRLLARAMRAAVAPLPEAAWNDPKAKLADRAESYLRVNCGHCHSAGGSASNSGLFFDKPMSDPVHYGIGKRPVAAGRGSGDGEFVIDPGHPEKSILIYRMGSTDPGIAMPELGRATVHAEGVDLLSKWIASMKPEGVN